MVWRSGNEIRQAEDRAKTQPCDRNWYHAFGPRAHNVDYCYGHMGQIGRWALTEGAATNVENLANSLMLLGTVTSWNGVVDSLVVPGKGLLSRKLSLLG